eukprot:TRINITY_DN16830_c0_g2_i1.p1 TRINITY_DN16830_c0_g2~~TRINITY_DN16830_c0_g2_i1.p1  ORF type:complete len:263 (+),score=42.41 TRINITY_DN16830_c0_g2_i1:162-950(+)
MAKLIEVEVGGDGVAVITLNRPEALNALTKEMISDLALAFRDLEVNPEAKVIILTGAGRAFCAGVDLTAATAVFKGEVKDQDKDPVVQMELCRKPIIGAINGFAITAGFEISLACDILIASTDAKFVDTHTKFGIFPSWGLSQKLPRLIGVNRARELSFTATPLDAARAEKWGLVNRVVPPGDLMKEARGIAEAILKNQQQLVVTFKAVVKDGLKLPLGDALRLEMQRAHEYYSHMRPEDFTAMQKFIAGRSSASRVPAAKL